MTKHLLAPLAAAVMLVSSVVFSCSHSQALSAKEMAISSATEFCNRQSLSVSMEDDGCSSDSMNSRFVVSLYGRSDPETLETIGDYDRILEIVEVYKNETLAKEYYASLDWSDVSSSWDIEDNPPLDLPVYGDESRFWNTANQERLQVDDYVLVFRKSCVVVEITIQPSWAKIEDELATTGAPKLYYNYLRMGLQRAITLADVAEARVMVE
jgi:hypothetical protein